MAPHRQLSGEAREVEKKGSSNPGGRWWVLGEGGALGFDGHRVEAVHRVVWIQQLRPWALCGRARPQAAAEHDGPRAQAIGSRV